MQAILLKSPEIYFFEPPGEDGIFQGDLLPETVDDVLFDQCILRPLDCEAVLQPVLFHYPRRSQFLFTGNNRVEKVLLGDRQHVGQCQVQTALRTEDGLKRLIDIFFFRFCLDKIPYLFRELLDLIRIVIDEGSDPLTLCGRNVFPGLLEFLHDKRRPLLPCDFF